MSKAMNDHWKGHLRLTLLRILMVAPGYTANSSILTTSAHGEAGFVVSRDQVRTELSWLAEQSLITTTEVIDGLVVATLTERGGDVASGRAVVPGVQRPNP
jgi:Fe2+ or Zn2+ uptake regulation protein